MFDKLGGDIVGMTNVPEVCLGREAEMGYATISMGTNYAAGISPVPLTHAEVVEKMVQNSKRLRRLVMRAVDLYDVRDLSCRHTLKVFGGFSVLSKH